jgi:hypothetical protein
MACLRYQMPDAGCKMQDGKIQDAGFKMQEGR